MQTAMTRMFKHMHSLAPDFTRPKGMHWQTYMRLLEQAHAAMLPAWQMVQKHNQVVERQIQALSFDLTKSATHTIDGLAMNNTCARGSP